MAKALTGSVQGQLPLEWIALIGGQYTTLSCHGHCLWWTDEVIINVIAMTFMTIEIVCIHVSSLKPTTRILGPSYKWDHIWLVPNIAQISPISLYIRCHLWVIGNLTFFKWPIILGQVQYESMFDARMWSFLLYDTPHDWLCFMILFHYLK